MKNIEFEIYTWSEELDERERAELKVLHTMIKDLMLMKKQIKLKANHISEDVTHISETANDKITIRFDAFKSSIELATEIERHNILRHNIEYVLNECSDKIQKFIRGLL